MNIRGLLLINTFVLSKSHKPFIIIKSSIRHYTFDTHLLLLSRLVEVLSMNHITLYQETKRLATWGQDSGFIQCLYPPPPPWSWYAAQSWCRPPLLTHPHPPRFTGNREPLHATLLSGPSLPPTHSTHRTVGHSPPLHTPCTGLSGTPSPPHSTHSSSLHL